MAASVNCWELITNLADRDLPNSDKCQAILDAIVKSKDRAFANEFTFTVHESGNWEIHLFDSYDDQSAFGVTLTVSPTGNITINRRRELQGGVHDDRTVRF